MTHEDAARRLADASVTLHICLRGAPLHQNQYCQNAAPLDPLITFSRTDSDGDRHRDTVTVCDIEWRWVRVEAAAPCCTTRNGYPLLLPPASCLLPPASASASCLLPPASCLLPHLPLLLIDIVFHYLPRTLWPATLLKKFQASLTDRKHLLIQPFRSLHMSRAPASRPFDPVHMEPFKVPPPPHRI
jgi:hypothetical protein